MKRRAWLDAQLGSQLGYRTQYEHENSGRAITWGANGWARFAYAHQRLATVDAERAEFLTRHMHDPEPEEGR